MNSPRELTEEIRLLIALLEREIAVVRSGNLELLPEIMPEKARLIEKLEVHAPELEAFISSNTSETQELQELLVEVRELVRRNTHIISRMAQSVRDVLREAFDNGDRKALGGLYDSRGRTNAPASQYSERFDRSL